VTGQTRVAIRTPGWLSSRRLAENCYSRDARTISCWLHHRRAHNCGRWKFTQPHIRRLVVPKAYVVERQLGLPERCTLPTLMTTGGCRCQDLASTPVRRVVKISASGCLDSSPTFHLGTGLAPQPSDRVPTSTWASIRCKHIGVLSLQGTQIPGRLHRSNTLVAFTGPTKQTTQRFHTGLWMSPLIMVLLHFIRHNVWCLALVERTKQDQTTPRRISVLGTTVGLFPNPEHRHLSSFHQQTRVD
jgi:hypothetical protein